MTLREIQSRIAFHDIVRCDMSTCFDFVRFLQHELGTTAQIIFLNEPRARMTRRGNETRKTMQTKKETVFSSRAREGKPLDNYRELGFLCTKQFERRECDRRTDRLGRNLPSMDRVRQEVWYSLERWHSVDMYRLRSSRWRECLVKSGSPNGESSTLMSPLKFVTGLPWYCERFSW